MTLVSSPFSDPENDTHLRTHWLVRRADRVYECSDYDTSFDTVTTSGLTEHTVNGLATGLKYIWKVGYVDSGSGTTSWSSEYSFKIGTSSADSNVQISAGTGVANFRMSSFYQWSDNPTSANVFGDEMGGSYNRNNFRIGCYDCDSNGYQECGSGVYIYPGQAYWFLARNGLDITVNGISVSKAYDIEVALKYNTGNGNGWNQIGCPNNADYYWGNVEVVEYDNSGNIVYGPTAISNLPDPNAYIDKRLWSWSNGSYDSNTAWMRVYEGYWVKAKKANVYLRFKVSAQARISNPETMLACLLGEGKRLIKKWVFNPEQAIADSGDSPPQPPGDFSVSASGGGSSRGGGGGRGGPFSRSGTGPGGGVGGGAGCFITTLFN